MADADSDEEPKPVVQENKDHQVLDSLDAEGTCIGTRTRGEVTEKGFWHRYVHVWVLNLPDRAVLMQLRAPQKKRFGGISEWEDPSVLRVKFCTFPTTN